MRRAGTSVAGGIDRRSSMARLSEPEVAAGLAGLSGWTGDQHEIAKTYAFATFVEAMAFVTRVADLAEAANHHPAIDIRYNRVRLRLTTHDQGGVTDQDLRLARQIEHLA
jgi:4a-hydroxytetrahydrobiopterin dehydratase